MSEQEPVMKPKNPGCIASGKRLAEWNLKNKENLFKEMQEPSQEPSQKSVGAHMAGVGALAILAIGLLVYF